MQASNNYQFFHRRNLPHIQPEENVFFITFCLNLPLKDAYHEYLNMGKKEIDNSLKNITNLEERKILFNKKLFALQDKYYDRYEGTENILQLPNCANLISNELHSYNKQLYDLYTFTIMPNHVHFLCKPIGGDIGNIYSLSFIMNRIKGRTSRFINLEMSRSGKLWQSEYYDHYVRNELELVNIVRYIIMNPVKAGLISNPKLWVWTWVMEEFRDQIDDMHIDSHTP